MAAWTRTLTRFTKLAHHLQDEYFTSGAHGAIGKLYTRALAHGAGRGQRDRQVVELSLEGAERNLDNNIIQHVPIR